MHIKTGNIYELQDKEDVREAERRLGLETGDLVGLTSDEVSELRDKPSKKRLLHPLAALDGMSADDVRKLRNQRKRLRRKSGK
jgi:hypothetical protein